ncbi:ras-related protein Rab-22A-like [Saccoglossus kowalevskii]|uniref:Ras-related protein Rab-22A-like n=1 Tax=Saccoglossus kowalevskii TaxID=10224 RepID=A0ABM0ME25_SACKO|nr:PREDICTED: ras-related protein Rab-22A-like [Saccoglossus kowalevskii]
MSMREIKLCLLGDSGVGKSSLVQRFVSDTFNTHSQPTIGASFMSKTLVVDDQSYKFQIWDTAGQEKYRGLAPMYYRGAAAAIIVYDITRESSFSAVKMWVRELEQYGPGDVVLAIAGNKADLVDQREVTYDEAHKYADQINATFVETSAKTAVNVTQLFTAITRKLPAEIIVSTHNTVRPTRAPQKSEKSKCCRS